MRESMLNVHASTTPPTSLFSLAQAAVEKRDVQKWLLPVQLHGNIEGAKVC